MERGRLAWLAMQRLNLFKYGSNFLNIAPEQFMLKYGVPRIGFAGYVGCDFDPGQYPNQPVSKIDLCGDLSELKGQKFDVIMHNHVLEHVPCSVTSVIKRLNGFIRKGGWHIFSIPISPNRMTEEDLSEKLSTRERLKRFGQEDHMRVFGGDDIYTIIRDSGMEEFADLSMIISKNELLLSNVPEETFDYYNSNYVFAWQKTSDTDT